MATDTPAPTEDAARADGSAYVFRHSGKARFAIWVVCLALGIVFVGALMALGDEGAFLTGGERVVLVVAVALSGTLFLLAANRARRMQRWRVTVEGGAVDLAIPGRRSGLDPSPAVHRRVGLDEIERVETRRTEIAGLGRVNRLDSTALRLSDGSAQKIGDTRVGRRLGGADDPGGDAGKAIAEALGAPLFERNGVAGKGRISMLSRVSTPPWDAPPMTPDERQAIERTARRKGAFVMIAFLVLSAVGIALE